jgi:hypothetical protein
MLAAFAGQNMTSGTVYAVAVPLLAGDVVTGIATVCTGSAGQQTLWRLGIYSKAGALLAQTGDVKAAFVMQTKPVAALEAAWTAPATDLYYFASIWIGSTPGSCLRVANQNGEQYAMPGAVQPYGAMPGQADLPATLAFGPPASTGAYGYWFAAIGTPAT